MSERLFKRWNGFFQTKRRAKRAALSDFPNAPFFAVVGLHSSGSSALAGALCRLGVAMGENFVGFYGRPPFFGGEDAELSEFLEAHLPVPSTTPRRDSADVRRWLDGYLARRLRDAKARSTVAGAKYPQIATLGDPMIDALGDRLRLIVCDRPIDESVRSLQKRFPSELPAAIEAHQRFLADAVRRLVSQVSAQRVLRVEFADSINAPRETIDRLAEFVRPEASSDERAAAVDHIRPTMKHF